MQVRRGVKNLTRSLMWQPVTYPNIDTNVGTCNVVTHVEDFLLELESTLEFNTDADVVTCYL